MEIELSEDLQHYKESFVLGLTVKQTFFSILALGTGTAIVLLLYTKIGVTLSCYVATPFVVPLALTGFYNYHGLTFWQFARKMIYFAFFNRPLLYWSTESVEELEQIFSEEKQEGQKARKRKEDIGTGSDKKKGKQKSGQEGAERKNGKKRANFNRRGKRTEVTENEVNREKKGMEAAGTETKRKRTKRRSKDIATVKKKRRGRNMASVVKKRKPVGMVIRRAIGMIFAIAGIFVAGVAMAAVWYGHYR